MKILEKIQHMIGNPEPTSEHTTEGIQGVDITAGPRNRDDVEEMREKHHYIFKTHLENGTFRNLLKPIQRYTQENPLINLQQLPFVVALSDLRQIFVFDPEKNKFRVPTPPELRQIISHENTLTGYTILHPEYLERMNEIWNE